MEQVGVGPRHRHDPRPARAAGRAEQPSAQGRAQDRRRITSYNVCYTKLLRDLSISKSAIAVIGAAVALSVLLLLSESFSLPETVAMFLYSPEAKILATIFKVSELLYAIFPIVV